MLAELVVFLEVSLDFLFCWLFIPVILSILNSLSLPMTYCILFKSRQNRIFHLALSLLFAVGCCEVRGDMSFWWISEAEDEVSPVSSQTHEYEAKQRADPLQSTFSNSVENH
jgi:hypothetical protein